MYLFVMKPGLFERMNSALVFLGAQTYDDAENCRLFRRQINQSANIGARVEPNQCRILPDGKRRWEGATYSPSHVVT